MRTRSLSLIIITSFACSSDPFALEDHSSYLSACPPVEGDEMEYYDFDLLNAERDTEALITTCEDARAFMARREKLEQEGPGIEVLAPFDRAARPERSDAIFGSTSRGIMLADSISVSMPGVVEVGTGCTGVLINERAVLTAAHCVDDLSPDGSKNFWANIRISSYEPAETLRFNDTARINIHPNYSGSGDRDDDVAMVKLLSGSFPGFPAGARTRIYTGTFANLGQAQLYGRGVATAGGLYDSLLRVMWFAPDWYGTYRYYRTVRENGARVCSGDSGAPLLAWTPANWRVVAGLHSGSQKNAASGECARVGGTQTGVRLNQKIAWIEDMLDVTCTPFSDNGWSYVRCFTP